MLYLLFILFIYIFFIISSVIGDALVKILLPTISPKRLYSFLKDGENLSGNDCIYVPVEKSLVSYGNKTHLEFTLNRTCIDNNQFNKALFELVCDKIENNDHYEFKGLENCTLLFHLKTHQACAQENLIVSLYKDKMNNDPGYSIETFPSKHTVDEEKDKQKMNNDPGYSIETFPSKHTVEKEKENSIRAKTLDVVHEQKTEGEKDRKDSIAHNSVKQNNLENCSVVNHQTGFRFSISSLNLNVSSPACPQIFFNDSDKSVALMFSLVKPCENSKTFKYTVIMECPPEDILQNTTKKGKCLEIFTIQLPEACKLFEKSFPDNRFTSGKIAGITIGTVGAILFLIGVSILTFLKCRGSKKRNSYDSIAYEKDADL